MSAAEAKFFADGNKHRAVLFDQVTDGKAEFRGNLNFSAYRQGRDPQYLGINGKNFYAKPWGNDSSNVQAVLNGPSYWKRVYYRPNVQAEFAKKDSEAARAEAKRAEAQGLASSTSSGGMRKCASEGALQRLPDEEPEPPMPPDGYDKIKENMKPYVERGGKPRIKAPAVGERLNFFNTMNNKYYMKAGGKNLSWNVCQEGHRSSKSEVRWILSNYFRTDTQAVLTGCGSEPVLGAEKAGGRGAAS